MNRLFLATLLTALLLLTCGCPKADKEPEGPVAPPQGTTLRLVVVDDPALAQSIGYLQSEWKAQSGVALEITEATISQFNPQEMPQADIVITPAWMLGPAAQAGWVVPLPDATVQGGQSEWSDIFPQIRSHEIAWGGRPMAISFGSAVPVLYYRPDLLADADVEAPTTWAEFEKAAAALPDASTAEPLAQGWAGITLLARAATHASHRDNLSTLFRIKNMEPLIAGQPFVRALEQLVATADPASLDMDPAASRAAFWQGKAAMAITWPTAADESLDELDVDFPAGVIELPGSADVYDVGDAAWEKRDTDADGRIPLMAATGRLALVTTASQWPDASLQLLLWLTGQKRSAQVCAASPNTTLFRQSHLGIVSAWTERPMPDDAARQYAEAAATALDRQQRLFALRLPGRADYLATLDEAVQAAVRKKKSPQEALDAAAARWSQITDQLGAEAQKKAYRASLGLK